MAGRKLHCNEITNGWGCRKPDKKHRLFKLTVKWRKEKGASSRAEESEKDCFVVLKS